MKLEKALKIVYELADANKLHPAEQGDSKRLLAEAKKQQEALDVLHDYLRGM